MRPGETRRQRNAADKCRAIFSGRWPSSWPTVSGVPAMMPSHRPSRFPRWHGNSTARRCSSMAGSRNNASASRKAIPPHHWQVCRYGRRWRVLKSSRCAAVYASETLVLHRIVQAEVNRFPERVLFYRYGRTEHCGTRVLSSDPFRRRPANRPGSLQNRGGIFRACAAACACCWGRVSPTESDHVEARAARTVDTVLKTPHRGYERYGSRWYLC